jgi:hypothetical protein
MLEMPRENSIREIMTPEEIEEAEWGLVQIIAHPVLFREFINESDENWSQLENHERAWSTCTSSYFGMCCGRGVRKTTAMIELLYWWMINNMFVPGDPGLFVVVPNKAQKDVIFYRIRSACEKHWLIKHFVSPNSINQNEGRIDFVNGFQFILRIAGSAGSESNVISVHTYRIWVDEAQDFPWRTWLSLQNVLKREIPGYQLIVSGVPNGERRENVLFECDQVDDKYVSFNIPQTMMSWWNPEVEFQRRKEYHAVQEDSEDYKHYVLGQHGMPTYSVFDRIRFLQEDFEIPKIVVTQRMFDSYAENVWDEKAEQTKRVYHPEMVLTPCPPLPLENGVKPLVGLGYDVGYSPDPAVFFIMYQTTNGTWRNLARFVLQRVEYGIQREAFVYLDRIYQFDFLGIDMGGPGKVQYQDLAGETSDYEPQYHYSERIYPVEFGGWMVVAARNDKGEIIEKKDQTKRVAVETVSRWVHEKRFVFAKMDTDLMEELERTKFTRTITGEPVYKTEDDHQMAAMMCAIMAYEHRFGKPLMFARSEFKPRLLPAGWLNVSKYGVM